MRLRTTDAGPGLRDGDRLVSVSSTAGRVLIEIATQEIADDGTIAVGWPVARVVGAYLVDLPGHPSEGETRVWVPDTEVSWPEQHGPPTRRAA